MWKRCREAGEGENSWRRVEMLRQGKSRESDGKADSPTQDGGRAPGT